MNTENNFFTTKGYQLKHQNEITDAMEDYLEMICRLLGDHDYIRINHLADKLNVRPSSCSKMVQNLKNAGYVDFEKYGVVRPTAKGWEVGKYLLYRHDVLHRFFCLVNGSECELEQVELIEHFLNKKTILNLEKLMERIKKEKLL